ncbi:MAG: hypothetical protein G8345_04950 [Magnetococcales bacterium]|nr:hypothetical protein [Magnetococcales bacterium]NGZ26219.1 hypothetical protein [Magnetococcales bacterium]
MDIYYRISENSTLKHRICGKWICLVNFFIHFVNKEDRLILIADNCSDKAVQTLKTLTGLFCPAPVKPLLTSLGNSASWRYACQQAMADGTESIYFVEDDYLHRPHGRTLLLEGLEIADYVTLYDHPDKYWSPEKGGNPLVVKGGEKSRVLRTPSAIWKVTNSTTMTFATRKTCLLRDRSIWGKHTESSPPDDFHAFLDIARHGAELISPLPAHATHGDLAFLAPGIDWHAVIGETYAQMTRHIRDGDLLRYLIP